MLTPAPRWWMAEEKIQEMVAAGFIEPANSPWAMPAVIVRRDDMMFYISTKDSYTLYLALIMPWVQIVQFVGHKHWPLAGRGCHRCPAKDCVYDRAGAVAVQGHQAL